MSLQGNGIWYSVITLQGRLVNITHAEFLQVDGDFHIRISNWAEIRYLFW